MLTIRWTIGPVMPSGTKALKLSVENAANLYPNARLITCYNGDVQLPSLPKQVEILKQDWLQCPIPHAYKPVKTDSGFDTNINNVGGSMWKYCPPRLQPDGHEIFMDNDLILLNRHPLIDRFLSDNKVLMLQDRIRCVGRYESEFIDSDDHYNAGFFGLPPRYDVGSDLMQVWSDHGCYDGLTQADEQGLTVVTLRRHPHFTISSNDIVELHDGGFPKYGIKPIICDRFEFGKRTVTGFHFVGLNKRNGHQHFDMFMRYLKCMRLGP